MFQRKLRSMLYFFLNWHYRKYTYNLYKLFMSKRGFEPRTPGFAAEDFPLHRWGWKPLYTLVSDTLQRHITLNNEVISRLLLQTCKTEWSFRNFRIFFLKASISILKWRLQTPTSTNSRRKIMIRTILFRHRSFKGTD